MRVAVVGHVEWVRFLRVDGRPEPGAILRAATGWEEPAGGGAVAAVALAELAGACTLVTALGDDAAGRDVPEVLGRHGVTVVGPTRPEPHRQAVTLIDPDGERTIVVVGPAQSATLADVPELSFEGFDAVYFCKGDAALLRRVRAARIVVATARVLDVVAQAEVRLDALVRSGRDPSERYSPGDLRVAPDLVAVTEGAAGGRWETATASGRWQAAPVDRPVGDTYGAGDRFAAGLAFALGQGRPVAEALAMAARAGAGALTRRGVGLNAQSMGTGSDPWSTSKR